LTPLPTEIVYFGLSVVLLGTHILLQSSFATLDLGTAYNASPRDEEKVPASAVARRAARALRNFLETYPAFIGLALALVVTNQAGQIGAIGAAVWFWARVVYIPLYLAGIAYLRSLAWILAALGLTLMLIALFF
jgi:uncharacterized MAPEG superfamily protein